MTAALGSGSVARKGEVKKALPGKRAEAPGVNKENSLGDVSVASIENKAMSRCTEKKPDRMAVRRKTVVSKPVAVPRTILSEVTEDRVQALLRAGAQKNHLRPADSY